MGSKNLVTALYDGRDPDSPAFVLGDRTVTTREAVESIGRYASALRAAGIEASDRVSFKLGKQVETLLLAHACLALGAVIHPLNSAYTLAETEFLLGDVEPSIFIGDPDDADDLAALALRLPALRIETLGAGLSGSLGGMIARAASAPLVPVEGPDGVAALLYTSGTTGMPKGARITHENLIESALALSSLWQVREDDVLLHALPLYHAHGLLTSINTTLIGGGAVLLLPRFDAAELLAAMSRATFMMGVPTFYARLLKEDGVEKAVHARFRLAISGSAPLAADIEKEFARRTGLHIIERYGATETAIVTAIPAGTRDRAGWVGWPLPGVEIRVRDEGGGVSPGPAIGGLETRGHNVFAGYWRRPDADREVTTEDGWFVTGDIAEIDDTGCVRLLGRSRDLIITGGLNVYPREVERALDGAAEIVESAVFGVPHPDFGEAVVAAVEGAGPGFDEAEAIASLRRTLAPYKIPKRIIPVERIPRNPLGKVLKTELREAHRHLFFRQPQHMQ